MSRKLTHAQVYAFILDRLDEAGSPRWDKPQVSRVFNAVYADWLRASCDKLLERDEKARRELGPLTISTSRPITSLIVDLEALNPTLYRLVSVSAEWDRNVRNQNGQLVPRTDSWPVSPIRHDQKATAKIDPWNRPTDDKARYSESRRQEKEEDQRPVELTLHCTSQPSRILIDYVHEPKMVDFRATPEGQTEIGYDTQIELMRRTVAMLATTDENFPAAQAGYSEIQINT
ncbi:MAG TPA: hypothetical protein VGB67_04045 [Fibrella sp.]|jgi:hypothetical protein